MLVGVSLGGFTHAWPKECTVPATVYGATDAECGTSAALGITTAVCRGRPECGVLAQEVPSWINTTFITTVRSTTPASAQQSIAWWLAKKVNRRKGVEYKMKTHTILFHLDLIQIIFKY